MRYHNQNNLPRDIYQDLRSESDLHQMTIMRNPFGDQTYNGNNTYLGNNSSVLNPDPKERVNATNDVNPLIMLSGDDGSASRSGFIHE